MPKLPYFDQHILNVWYREGVAASLGIKGPEVNNKPELVGAGFWDGEARGCPGGGGCGDESMLVEGGDLIPHELGVCWRGSDGWAGGRRAKSVDFKGCHVSGVVEIRKVEGEGVNVIVDGLVVRCAVVGWKVGVDDLGIEGDDPG